MAASSIGYARIAWRMLIKQPGLALGRILTITVVITAVGAVLTVANAIFLRPCGRSIPTSRSRTSSRSKDFSPTRWLRSGSARP